MITVLVSPEAIEAAEVEVDGESYRHLFRARRLAAGAEVRLADGEGRARWATVERVERSRALLRPGEAAPPNEPHRQVELLVPLPRPQRAAWLVEKATEVGVAAIRWLAGDRAPRGYGPAARDRLARVAAAALEQCHRARLPEITGVHGRSERRDLLAAADVCWLLDREAPEPTGPVAGAGQRVSVVAGPEGGWTAEESEALRQAGCRPLGLGPTVLRVETAALVGAVLALR